MSIDAMKQALAVLAFYYGQHGYELDAKVIIALRTAIKHAERPQTHSDDCWRWHHQCAVTKIERMQTQKPAAMKKAYKAMGLLGPDLICEVSHHGSKDQHGMFTPCPIEHRWREAYKALGAAIEQPSYAR